MALKGIRVLELCGLAPVPFAGMILSDFGASVIRVDRIPQGGGPGGSLQRLSDLNFDVTARGKESISVDLKRAGSVDLVKDLVRKSDVLVEPFRPGVMEKLGLGPQVLRQENPGLIYARLTGFGQFQSPYKNMAGHDINYLALSGVLSKLGRKGENPLPPVNLMADFAGGGLTCVMGILAALIERSKSGKGQIIDCNMVEGAAYVGSWLYKSSDTFLWGNPRGENFLDSGTHFYQTYKTRDQKYVAVGAIEPQFYAQLLGILGLKPDECPQFGDNMDELKTKFAEIFATKTRDEWSELFTGSDACVTPIWEFDEAQREKPESFEVVNGKINPIPAPRLSRTPGVVSKKEDSKVGQHTVEILKNVLNYDHNKIQALKKNKNIFDGHHINSKL